MTCTEFFILGYQTAGSTGGPAILIIQPCQHLFALSLIHTGLDQIHILITQVGSRHAGTHMHVTTAKTHLFQHFHLPKQFFFL